jgi:hypothetical protein
MKVIIHYQNGKKYTLNNVAVSYTNWHPDGRMYLRGDICGTFYDVLFLEEIDKECGIIKYHFNPNEDMSVVTDVMTAQQRAKSNRNGILQTANNILQHLKRQRHLYEK